MHFTLSKSLFGMIFGMISAIVIAVGSFVYSATVPDGSTAIITQASVGQEDTLNIDGESVVNACGCECTPLPTDPTYCWGFENECPGHYSVCDEILLSGTGPPLDKFTVRIYECSTETMVWQYEGTTGSNGSYSECGGWGETGPSNLSAGEYCAKLYSGHNVVPDGDPVAMSIMYVHSCN